MSGCEMSNALDCTRLNAYHMNADDALIVWI